MKLSKEQMEYLEQMTMLRVPEELRPKMMEEIGQLVEYIESLKFTDSEEEEDAPIVTEEELREDEVKTECKKEEIIANAPMQKDGMFIVPKTISEQGEVSE